MQNLQRRASGIYVTRLTVPIGLRSAVGRRELIASTGTTSLALAKVVAVATLSLWRRRLLDLGHCEKSTGVSLMSLHESILRVATAHPALLAGGHLPLEQAAGASGIEVDGLLRAVEARRLRIFFRSTGTPGHVLRTSDLEVVDTEVGSASGRIVPHPHQMPPSAVEITARGVLAVPRDSQEAVASALLADPRGVADVVLFDAQDKPGYGFAPSSVIRLGRDCVELSASEVEALRVGMAAALKPEDLAEAKELRRIAAMHTPAKSSGKHANRKVSAGLKAFARDHLAHKLSQTHEIQRICRGIELFAELEGDPPLGDVDADRLRAFRDKLALVPAHENRIRQTMGTKTFLGSMKAVEGLGKPTLSTKERDQRMQWLARYFGWLHRQGWIAADPMLSLRGESSAPLAERREAARRDDEARPPFTTEELAQIFGVSWFQSGRGDLTAAGTSRTFQPFYYWAPLIAVLSGARENEIAQLWLEEIEATPAGTWFMEIAPRHAKQRVKNTPSRRLVPLHPVLIQCGLLKYVVALREAGYDRLFPELKHNTAKGYAKAVSSWTSRFMRRLGFAAGTGKDFHAFRHTVANGLPDDTPERVRRQLVGHERGRDVHDKTYRHDVDPDVAITYLQRMKVTLPAIAPFDVAFGLKAVRDALQRKDGGRGAAPD